MSYKLLKPYTEIQRMNFIVEYNHKQGLRIEENETAMIALEDNEILENGEPIIDVNYEKTQKQLAKNRIKLLSMTKLDFFKHVLYPSGIDYEALQAILDEDLDLKVAWDLCSRVYRGDEKLNQWAESAEISSEVLDERFKKYGE